MSTMKKKEGRKAFGIDIMMSDQQSTINKTVNSQKFVCTKWFTNREIFSSRMNVCVYAGAFTAPPINTKRNSEHIHYTPIIRSSSEFLILSFVCIAFVYFAFDFNYCCWCFVETSFAVVKYTYMNLLCRIFLSSLSHSLVLCVNACIVRDKRNL